MARLLFAFAALGMSGCLSLTSTGASLADTRGCTPDQAAALPQGARVELMLIQNRSGLVTGGAHVTKRVGTVLKSSPDGVALINCVVEQRNQVVNRVVDPLPVVGRLTRNTGVGMDAVPVVWVPLAEMGNVRIVEPPPADHVPLTLEIETAPPRPEFEAIGVEFDFSTGEAFSVRAGESIGEPRGRGFIPPTDGAGVQSLD